MARDAFWELLIDLSRNQGVTIFVSTHFMNEAARCDRLSLMDAGRVLATDAPADLVRARGARTLEDAFVGYLEEAAQARGTAPRKHVLTIEHSPAPAATTPAISQLFSFRRMLAYAVREALELIRDPIRLGFALGGTAFLMLVFGFGITTDVNSLTFAVLDRDNTYESRAYLEELRGSAYFVEQPSLKDAADLQDRLKTGQVTATVEIPPGFGRDIKRARPTAVGVWIDGAMPFRAETIRGYLEGAHQQFLADPAVRGKTAAAAAPLANLEVRFRYNQDFDSVYAMVPAQIALQLALIPAILMALAIVREKELGSIVNLYVTPVTRLEFLLGKQIPYVVLAMINFVVLLLMAWFIFGVPLKGSFPLLALAALVYVTTTTAYGRVISTFTSTQIAALFGTAILTVLPATMFAGMLVPISSITGIGAILGRLFPMTYFLPISVGTFTKGLGFADLTGHLLALAVFVPVLTLLSLVLLRRQEK
jgi:ribosome-dependent ATPase